ncbi:MAG: alpha/beta hydrolase [Anaerolineae bacterium]|nr:alpha/beta hydrolase [Anaerolineae bacterium]
MQCAIRDLTIHYDDIGDGTPLIIIHGRGADRRSVMHTLEPLFADRDGWRRLYLDVPGAGQTRAPDWLSTHNQLLDAIVDFIDAVIPGQRFAIAGVSYGAYLARGVVYRRAAHLDGVMLVVPSVERDPSRQRFPAQATLKADPDFEAALQPDERWLLNSVVAQSRPLLDEVRAVLLPALTAADSAFLQRLDSTPGFSFDVDGFDAPCSAPSLILAGRQDSVCGFREAWSILDNYPRATYAVLDCAGHMLTREQPALFRALARDWLDRVQDDAHDTDRKV